MNGFFLDLQRGGGVTDFFLIFNVEGFVNGFFLIVNAEGVRDRLSFFGASVK